jgi:hypothetical protein
MRPFLSGLLSLVFPGAGQVYAGRIGRGLAIAALAASAVVLAAWFAGREALADHVVSLDVLLGLLVANALVLFVRFWIVADAYVLAAREQRRALGRPNALVAALSLLVLGVLTAAPHTVLGWGTYVTYDTIDNVFADEEPQDVLSPAELAFLPTLVPGTSQALHGDRPVAPPDPEPESRKWTTVLLVGGDAGYLRVGLRADFPISWTRSTASPRRGPSCSPGGATRAPRRSSKPSRACWRSRFTTTSWSTCAASWRSSTRSAASA